MILYNNNYEYDNYVNILDCMITVILLMYCFHTVPFHIMPHARYCGMLLYGLVNFPNKV